MVTAENKKMGHRNDFNWWHWKNYILSPENYIKDIAKYEKKLMKTVQHLGIKKKKKCPISE